MAIEEGKTAPAFTLFDTDGNKVALKDFKGKNVIVYFYPKDDTPGCTKEACGFRDLWKEIQQLNTVVLGVSPDDGNSHRKFINKYKLPFILLSDPDKKMMTKYEAYGEKMMYGKKQSALSGPQSGLHPMEKLKNIGAAFQRQRITRPKCYRH